MIDLCTYSLAFGLPGGAEWFILLFIGLLIFGRRLPEVGRSIGKTIVEFKRGIKEVENEIETESSRPAKSLDDRAQPRDQLNSPSHSGEVPAAAVGSKEAKTD